MFSKELIYREIEEARRVRGPNIARVLEIKIINRGSHYLAYADCLKVQGIGNTVLQAAKDLIDGAIERYE